MKHFYLINLFLFFNSIILASNFGNLSYGYAINIAGKQRMLSQRISKTALLKANHMGSVELDLDLEASITLFEANHKTLYRNAAKTDERFTKLLNQSFENWKIFKETVSKFDGGDMISLLSKSKALLNDCQKFVIELEAEANFASEEFSATEDLILQTSTINISGEQRMLCQKYSLYFLASELYGMQSVFKKDLSKLRQEQRDDLSFLIFNSLNNDKIEEHFMEVTMLFELLDKYTSMHSDMSLLKVVSFCDRISNLYDEITNNYTKLYEDINSPKNKKFSSLTSTNK